MIAEDGQCLCYPSPINRRLLGSGYPFFIENQEQFIDALQQPRMIDPVTVGRIQIEHSYAGRIPAFAQCLNKPGVDLEKQKKWCFAGHDFKFSGEFYFLGQGQGPASP